MQRDSSHGLPGWSFRPRLLFVVPAALVSCLACTSSTSLQTELEGSLAALERRLQAFAAATPTRDELAFVLEAVNGLLDNEVSGTADLKEDLRQLLAEVETLRVLIEEQGRSLDASLERQKAANDELAIVSDRLEQQEVYLLTLGQQPETSIQPPAAPSEEPWPIYAAAYQHYLSGTYEQAVTGFEDYLSSFPDGEDADSAQYWLGESYLALGRFHTAIEQLRLVVERYPESDKIASSMLRIGVAYIELGDRERANEMLQQVREEYPDSDEAILALQQLDTGGDDR